MKSIVVISGKGGVGKTLVSCLLAQELAKKYGSTGLCDLDVDSSNIAKVMDVKMDRVQLTDDRKVVPIERDNLKINSLSAILTDTSISQTGKYYRRVVRDIITNTAWGDIDFLVADMPPSISDIFRETIEILKSNNTLLGAVIVEQPSEVEDCKRAYEICKRLFIPAIGFVENMSGAEMHGKPVLCPCGCGREFAPWGSGDIKEYAREVGGDFIGRIPLSYELANTRPPQINDGMGAQTISRLAKKIAIAGMPRIPEDTIREAAGTFKFVGRVIKSLLELVVRANSEYDVAKLREMFGRKKNRGFVEFTITDCPQALSEYKTIYIGILGRELKMYKKKEMPDYLNVIASVRASSGPLACVIKGKIPVMDPFTHRRYYDEYTFTKAVNNGDIEIEGDNVFTEFILADNLFAHASEITGVDTDKFTQKALKGTKTQDVEIS